MTDVVTTGTWVKVDPIISPLRGVSSSFVSWGTAAGSGRTSGYRFAGKTVPAALDGSEFTLGTFTHENFPILLNGPQRFQVTLKVQVALEGGPTRDFSFPFRHYETPNVGNPVTDADEVDLPTVRSPETVVVDGRQYSVEISGFKQRGTIVTKFISPENASNTADIVAKFVLVGEPTPEEPTPDVPPPTPEEPPVPEEIVPPSPSSCVTHTFEVLNVDGSVFGRGCFTYFGEATPVDLAHVLNGSGYGPTLTDFWYNDPLVGTMSLDQVLTLNFVSATENKRPRFALNVFNIPDDATGVTAGTATPARPGAVSTHRAQDDEFGGTGRTLTFPEPCRVAVDAEPQGSVDVVPLVDLVVVIDSSVSMKPEATSLSQAVSAAIEAARSSCPSDLTVAYLGIEGKLNDSLFRKTIREHLVGNLGLPESELRGRRRGAVTGGGAQEDSARAVEDVASHYDWRPNALRAIFLLCDEALEGGDPFDADDVAAATRAIDVASQAGVRVHTYLGKSGERKAWRRQLEDECARLAASTGGQSFTSNQGMTSGFQAMLEEIICASKVPIGDPETKCCDCCRESVEPPAPASEAASAAEAADPATFPVAQSDSYEIVIINNSSGQHVMSQDDNVEYFMDYYDEFELRPLLDGQPLDEQRTLPSGSTSIYRILKRWNSFSVTIGDGPGNPQSGTCFTVYFEEESHALIVLDEDRRGDAPPYTLQNRGPWSYVITINDP